MTSRSRAILIGSFVFVAIFVAILMILALGGSMFSSMLEYRLYFDRSVRGLSGGSPVMFRGVRVGQVRSIKLSMDAEWESEQSELWPIEVSLELDPAAFGMQKKWYDFFPEPLIKLFVSSEKLQGIKIVIAKMVEKEGLRAQLQTLSLLTGQLSIELNFFPDAFWNETMASRLAEDILPVEDSSLDYLKQTLSKKEFGNYLDTFSIALQEISIYVNEGKFKKFLADLTLSAENASIILQNAVEKMNPAAKHLGIFFVMLEGILDKFNQGLVPLIASANDTMQIVNRHGDRIAEEIHVLVQESRDFMSHLDALIEQQEPNLGEFLQKLSHSTEKVDAVLLESQKLLLNLQESTSPESGLQNEMKEALSEIQKAASSLRSLAEYLQMKPESLLRGKGE